MWTVIGTILIVLGAIGAGLLIDRRWSILPRKDKLLEAQRRPRLPGHEPGEAPATAIAASPAEIEKLRRKKCEACRGETDALADDHADFDGARLLILHARCRECSRTRAVYVRPLA